MKNALDHFDEIISAPPALFLDFDGTLAEISPRPTQVVLSQSIRDVLGELHHHGVPVAVVSGRDLDDLRRRIALPDIAYAGSHGFDLLGPAPEHTLFQPAVDALPALDAIEAELRARLDQVPGIFMERKRFAFAVHYRQVEEAKVSTVAQEVATALPRHAGVQMRPGKKVFEMVPDLPWGKGSAVTWLLEKMKRTVTPIYVGDDITDEEAFVAVRDRGVGIVVQEEPTATAASFSLRTPNEVERFLWKVAERFCR